MARSQPYLPTQKVCQILMKLQLVEPWQEICYGGVYSVNRAESKVSTFSGYNYVYYTICRYYFIFYLSPISLLTFFFKDKSNKGSTIWYPGYLFFYAVRQATIICSHVAQLCHFFLTFFTCKYVLDIFCFTSHQKILFFHDHFIFFKKSQTSPRFQITGPY